MPPPHFHEEAAPRLAAGGTPAGRSSTAKWASVGNSGNAEACKILVDSETLGCSGGSTPGRNETDAVVACANTP
jgi:hypothetical protein